MLMEESRTFSWLTSTGKFEAAAPANGCGRLSSVLHVAGAVSHSGAWQVLQPVTGP
jgi:hypothetical protein